MTPKYRYFPSVTDLLLVFTVVLLGIKVSASSRPKLSYAEYCGSLVPQYSTTGVFASSPESFKFTSTHFTGGEKLFDSERSNDSSFISNSHFIFHANYIHKTQSADTLQIGGSLSIRGPQLIVSNPLVGVYESMSRSSFVRNSKYVNFELSGFWSESRGLICMVGTASVHSSEGKSLRLSAVFKLNYPKVSNISTSLVTGTVESLDPVDSLSFFEKISFLAYAQNNYSYIEFPPSVRNSCTNLRVPKETRGFEGISLGSNVPNLLNDPLELVYENACSGGNCYPFTLRDGSAPSSLSLNQIYFSAEGKVHTLIGFSGLTSHWFNQPLEPGNTFVGEGFWDFEKNQMCLVACHILANTSIGDCTIGLSLWFPLVFSIKSRNTVMGNLWSIKRKNDSTLFSIKSFRHGSHVYRAPNIKYKYSALDGAGRCDPIKNSTIMGYRTYPDGSSREDLSFSMQLTRGETYAHGYASPVSLGDTVVVDSFTEMPMESVNATQWNVSYDISYSFFNKSSSTGIKHTQISAEGLYNSRNGLLCMVGCMYTRSVPDKQRKVDEDCSILVNIQFPPTDPKKGEDLNGTIKSTRHKLDPLYFDPLLVSAQVMYDAEAAKSIWRMDIELIMVVMSLTFSCAFVRSQILYAKKHRDVLADISITMLAVMTLGYLIPLTLNFESLLIMIRNRKNFFSWSDEWVVVKEVVVRVLTLVAFVLHFRLLQVAWSARSASGRKEDLWVAEKKTLKLCLLLYFAVAAMDWLVHSVERSQSWEWEDLLSYAGCILDGFLLPQIMMNLFQRSQGKALSLFFYAGMTAVRIFPHFYDLYRAHNLRQDFDSSFIYASSEMDFFSSSSDIIIPLAGILFATSIFLQQRFGGNCILPSRFRKQGAYLPIAELSL